MRKKTIYVSFQPMTARIYVNQRPPKQFPYLKNPDFKQVRGLPPHEWTISSFKGPRMPYKRLLMIGMGVALALAVVGGLWIV